MNILYLSACGQIGGAERSLLDVLASIRTDSPQYSLHLLSSEDGPLVTQTRALGIPVTVVKFPRTLARIGDAGAGGPAGEARTRRSLIVSLITAAPGILKFVLTLRRMLRSLNPDVIHSNGFKMHVLAVLVSGRIPIIWHIHDYVSVRPVMAKLLRSCSRRCALAVANSESVAADLRSVCGKRLIIHTVYNAVDLDRFSPAGPTTDLDLLAGLPSADARTIRVGLLATLARWKGHETFLRAISMVPAGIPLRAYVIGDALYRTEGSQHTLTELKTLAKKLGLSDGLGFTGFVEDPAAAMRALDIIVHASTKPEPFGLVIAEGLACGKPVIASDGAGATELITTGDVLNNSAGDASQLAACITRLASDADLRLRLARSARATAERYFDRRRLAAQLIPIYRSSCNGGQEAAELSRQAGSLSYGCEAS